MCLAPQRWDAWQPVGVGPKIQTAIFKDSDHSLHLSWGLIGSEILWDPVPEEPVLATSPINSLPDW